MKNIKILPCPFCGGEGELLYGGEGFGGAVGISHVRCKKCGAVGEKFKVDRRYSSDKRAIKAWNRRPNND